jgi:hypothetical protein
VNILKFDDFWRVLDQLEKLHSIRNAVSNKSDLCAEPFKLVDRCDIISCGVPVAQWIEHWSPERESAPLHLHRPCWIVQRHQGKRG